MKTYKVKHTNAFVPEKMLKKNTFRHDCGSYFQSAQHLPLVRRHASKRMATEINVTSLEATERPRIDRRI